MNSEQQELLAYAILLLPMLALFIGGTLGTIILSIVGAFWGLLYLGLGVCAVFYTIKGF